MQSTIKVSALALLLLSFLAGSQNSSNHGRVAELVRLSKKDIASTQLVLDAGGKLVSSLAAA